MSTQRTLSPLAAHTLDLPRQLYQASTLVTDLFNGFNRAEADTHADTTAVGPDAYIQHYTGYHVTVHPFTEGLLHLADPRVVQIKS